MIWETLVRGTHGLADCSAESNGKDAQLLTYKIQGQFERDPDAPSVPRNEAPNHPREDHPLGEHADSDQLEYEAGHQLSHADQPCPQTRIEELHLPTDNLPLGEHAGGGQLDYEAGHQVSHVDRPDPLINADGGQLENKAGR